MIKTALYMRAFFSWRFMRIPCALYSTAFMIRYSPLLCWPISDGYPPLYCDYGTQAIFLGIALALWAKMIWYIYRTASTRQYKDASLYAVHFFLSLLIAPFFFALSILSIYLLEKT